MERLRNDRPAPCQMQAATGEGGRCGRPGICSTVSRDSLRLSHRSGPLRRSPAVRIHPSRWCNDKRKRTLLVVSEDRSDSAGTRDQLRRNLAGPSGGGGGVGGGPLRNSPMMARMMVTAAAIHCSGVDGKAFCSSCMANSARFRSASERLLESRHRCCRCAAVDGRESHDSTNHIQAASPAEPLRMDHCAAHPVPAARQW